MVGWMKMCEDTSRKLERELEEKEIEFIKWVYNEHSKEEKIKIDNLKINN